jgi:hypothetical protein
LWSLLLLNLVSDTIGVLFHFAVVVLFKLKDKPDIVISITGGDVQMKVENGLPCDAAVIREYIESFEVETLDECTGHNSGGFQERRITLGLEVEEVTVMDSRDDEGMPKTDWIDVKDSNDPIVFEENLRRNFAGDNIAENAIAHEAGSGYSESMRKNLFKNRPKVKKDGMDSRSLCISGHVLVYFQPRPKSIHRSRGTTMKNISTVAFTVLLAVAITTLGFQCGSPEFSGAKLRIQQKDYKGAINLLEKEVQKNPTNEEAWFLLG